MATANQAIQRAAKAGNSETSNFCYICEQTLWISVFFDEPGHDAEAEYGTDKLSNIGKLRYSHAFEPKLGIYPLYYNGLGVKFKEPNITRVKTGVDIAKDTGQDTVEGKAEDAGEEVLKKGKKGAQSVLDDLKNPKNWGWDIAGILARVGIESADPVRDNATVSQITLSGVATRVDNAVAMVKRTVDRQTLPVKHINLAVFGSGLGGAMARLFINKLLEVCAPKALPDFPIASGAPTIYPTAKGDTTLEISFLGLLDCVSATLSDNWLVSLLTSKASFGFATTRINGPMGVPEEVLQTAHYIAAHELRVTQRLDSIRKGFGQIMTETLLPGNHDDVVGNYQDGFKNRSNQLARIALQKLHGDAYGAGVPLMSMPTLAKKDIDLYNLMQATAKALTHRGKSNAKEMYMGVMIRNYPKTSGKLEAQFLQHMCLLMSWMSLRFDVPGSYGRPGEKAYNMLEKRRKQIEGWEYHPHGRTYLNLITKEEIALLNAFLSPTPMDDYVQTLFDDFIHDESYDNRWNLAAADYGKNSYFNLRAIDESNEVNGVAKVREKQKAKWKAESDEYARMTGRNY